MDNFERFGVLAFWRLDIQGASPIFEAIEDSTQVASNIQNQSLMRAAGEIPSASTLGPWLWVWLNTKKNLFFTVYTSIYTILCRDGIRFVVFVSADVVSTRKYIL